MQRERFKLQFRLGKLPIRQQPLTQLIRKREEVAESLKTLQRKLEEAHIAEAQKLENLRVIEKAKPTLLPISPRPTVVLLLATICGVVLGMGVHR
ncbi:GNVR domain-containing protein [Richelia intracellularis]|mgnify:CR=1 FL=1|uniref:GNVR domain-containing protein n=1 Tax=Richelia intracellularis TaxID=1164990 RepID=UPI0005C7E4D9|nr:GNVR domain-containing protein [Richelia intracellularis]